MLRAARLIALAPLALIPLSACITLKPEHEALEKEVWELRKKVEARDQELSATLKEAAEQMARVEEQLKKAEELLHLNQASLGVRVENLEYELSQVRGQAEDSLNEIAALTQNVAESRADIDTRLGKVETAVNAEADIPEGKTDLLKEAERTLEKKDYARSRRLFRTYLSRYPSDPKEAEVRFKIGLTLFSERDYRSALGEFYWLVQNAPESEVIHDAVYYSGLAFAKLGQCDKSLAYFNAILKKDSGAPERYKTQAKKQVETLEKDDGKICTDKSKDGAVEGDTPPAPTPAEAEKAEKADKKSS
jgi:TolA-binding protein